ncbi:TPA: helix-turn-helix transcriptional regulator [Streptococcus suis]|nr:helix-turn-helix transcriptional regulator [Streptococcus suis]HEM4991030.1 helix-turn-helix transcriptional regulator [Streptococcus suis]HEM5206954.1 helix-turn-helix transcriptional regulator [Streptococcus suis]HEM5227527.1 helix-turn-helix transcriptional regulator [Streptococcus suis]HEM5229838.1 helix-turn-helix transcriptional regulator [Streptococcus suis]
MTQEELANLLGKGQSYVSKYEQCQKRLDIFEVRSICLVCNKNFIDFINELEYIIGGKEYDLEQ